MQDPIESYWSLRLETCRKALERNNFDVFIAQTAADARRIFLQDILPGLNAHTAAWGDSLTMQATGVLDDIRRNPDMELIQTFESGVPREMLIERRRKALLTDLFLTGTNALTQGGQLVNLDMIGNRIGGLTFGPNHVVVLIGRNKLVADVEDAMFRIKNYVAPANAMRLDKKTPCTKTAACEACQSPDRICNTWTITEKAFPKGRVTIVLIDEALGI